MKTFLKVTVACLLLVLSGLDCFAQSGIITTYFTFGLPDNDTPATKQYLDNPGAIAPDTMGGFYISSFSEKGESRIFHVSADGRIRLVVLSGTRDVIRNGGHIASAQLKWAQGIAVDSKGNLYIADSGNNRVHMVTPEGVISIIAGNGAKGHSGDNGPAIMAQLSEPKGVTVDSKGNLYIADAGNRRICKVTPDGVITTVTEGLWNLAHGMAVDSSDNLYIINLNRACVYRVTSKGTVIVAGNGTRGFSSDGGKAISAQLTGPNGITIDAADNLYIADAGKVRKVTPDGNITTVAGKDEKNSQSSYSRNSTIGDGGSATSARIGNASDVAIDSTGNLLIADSSNKRIRRVTPNGVITTIAGGGYNITGPTQITVDAMGNLYFADTTNSCIRKVTPAGVITTVAGNGTRGFSGDGGQAISAQLSHPNGTAVDSAGNLFIIDRGNFRIRKVAPDGVISTVVGNGDKGFSGDGGQATSAQLYGPRSLAVDSFGNIYITEVEFSYIPVPYGDPSPFGSNHRLRKVSSDGVITTIAGHGVNRFKGDTDSTVLFRQSGPKDIAVDSAGNLYITDVYSSRIRKVTPDGVFTTVSVNRTSGYTDEGDNAGSALPQSPSAIAVDSAGNIYIADSENNRIDKIAPDGTVTIVAGNGTEGFSGDGGPAPSAQLSNPSGIAADSSGNIYISDRGNHRIRKVTSASH